MVLNDYVPINSFVLVCKNLVKSVATICRKFVSDFKKAKIGVCNVAAKLSEEIRRAAIGMVELGGSNLGST